ncbi:MAG: hypothetical protein GWP18_00465 [Proteobacteria bacterium]|nr:hypothetical protein [Pseudomonadota bacterium]
MKHRTAIVTAASVAVVILAATAAIATNLGILNSGTDTGEVGELSVATAQESVVTTSAPTTAPLQTTTTADDDEAEDTDQAAPAGEISAYVVGDAGTVTLANDGSMLTIIEVEASSGWETAQVLDGTAVDIGFVSSDGTVLRFLATINPDGSVETVVEDLTPISSDDDDYDDDDDDDDDDHEDDDDD